MAIKSSSGRARRSDKLPVKRPAKSRPHLQLEILEQRMLYSADLPGFTFEVSNDDSSNSGSDALPIETEYQAASTLVSTTQASHNSRELVFIDTTVPDSKQLLADLTAQIEAGRQIEVIRISPQEKGLDVITDTLESQTDISGVHIISHGTDAGIAMGSQWIDASVASQHSDQLQQWQQALSSDADLLLYGCNLAASDEGKALLQELADTTGADVAASDDVTGHTRLSGDWQLEYATGPIESESALSSALQNQWENRLALDLLAVDDDLGDVLVNTAISLDSINAPDTNILLNDQTSAPSIYLLSADGAANGTITTSATQTAEYQPNLNYTGQDSFDYIVTDSEDPILNHYPLNSNQIIDETGRTDPAAGSVSNTPAFNGTSYDFDGADDYIELSDIDYTQSFTISFDFRIGNLTGGNQHLYSHGTGFQQNSLQVWVQNQTLFVSLSDSSETGPDTSPFQFDISAFSNTSDWHQLQITHAPINGFNIYIDSVDQDAYTTAPRGGDFIDPAGNITIGAYQTSAGAKTDFLDTHQIQNLRIYNDVVTPAVAAKDIHYSTAAATLNIREVNQAPLLASLDDTPLYQENASPIALDTDVTVSDAELTTDDNYSGATLTINRTGGAQNEDVFSAISPLSALVESQPFSYTDPSAGIVELGSVVKNTNGILELEFNSDATATLVNKTLQAIGYQNSSESPPASASLDWVFSDGYSGSSQFGTEQSDSGAIVVSIDDNADITIDVPSVSKETFEDTALGLSNDISISHDQNPTDVLSTTLSVANGSLSVANNPVVTISGNGSDTLTIDGAVADINSALQSLSYLPDPDFNGNDLLNIFASTGAPVTSATASHPITVIAVNDAPEINNAGDTTTYEITTPPVIIDPDISLSDIELEAAPAGSYASATLSLTRSDSVDYAPSPRSSANPTDAFSASAQPGNLAQGSNVVDGATVFGNVTTNSGGLLSITFNNEANKSRIDALMRTIEYRNNSNWKPDENGWPHDSVELIWTFNDNGVAEDGSQNSAVSKSVAGYSTIDITTTDSQPAFAVYQPLKFNVGSPPQLFSKDHLAYIDLDAPDSSIVYQLTGVPAEVFIFKDGTQQLLVGDSFTQEDINTGKIYISTNETATSTKNIQFDIYAGGSFLWPDDVDVKTTKDAPSELLSGVRLNMDGGNDAFLADGQFLFMNGGVDFTHEFTFSELQVNPGNLETTLYSAVATSGPFSPHYEHLVIVPIPGTTDGMLEWDQPGLTTVTNPAISTLVPGVFDGEVHSVALTFSMKAFGEMQLFYDGVFKASANNTFTQDFQWGGGYPRAYGQQLMMGSEFSPANDFSQFVFDQGKHFSGVMHEARVWSEIRSENEIRDHWRARYDNSPDNQSTLVVDWHMHDPGNGIAFLEAVDTTTSVLNAQPQPINRVGHASGPGFIPSTPTDELFINENSANGDLVGYIMPQDPDPDMGNYLYEIVEIGQPSAFNIEPSTGKITLADKSLLAGHGSIYHLHVSVQNGDWTEYVPIHIIAANAAPTLDPGPNTTLSHTEGDAPAIVNPLITAQDNELDSNAPAIGYGGATVVIERYTGSVADPQPQDQLSSDLITAGSTAFTVNQTGSTLSVTFNAGATVTDVNDLLQSIRYQNTSDDPQSGITLGWTFSDGNTGAQGSGGMLTDTVFTTVSITPVNDAPTLSPVPMMLFTTQEDTSIQISGNDLLPYSGDADGNVVQFNDTTLHNGSLSLQNGTGSALNNIFIWTPPPNSSGLIKAFEVTAVDNQGAVSTPAQPIYIQVNPVSDRPSGTDLSTELAEDTPLTLDRAHFGFSDVDNDAFQSVIINNVSNGAVQLSGVTIAPQAVMINDVDAGLLTFHPAPNLFDATANITFTVNDDGFDHTASGSNVLSIALTQVNDPPISADFSLTTIEDTPLSLNSTDFAFNDNIDNGTTQPAGNAPYSVIIDAVPANGALHRDGIALQPGDTVLYTEIDSALTYVPAANDTSASFFDFSLRDNGGTMDGGIDTSIASYRMDLNITPVNDAPFGTDNTIDVLEGSEHVFSQADFGFMDPLDSNNLANVQLLTLPADGTLLYNNTMIAAGTAISSSDIDSGLLKYVPPANTEGNANTDFTFRVADDGGTQNAGVAVDPGLNTITIINRGVNSPPIVDPGLSVTVIEDTIYTFSRNDFTYSDSENHDLATLIIDSTTIVGTLSLNGSTITSTATITATDLDTGSLVYTPAANSTGTAADSFTLRLQDTGGVINGGSDISSPAGTLVINVANINDAPVLATIEAAPAFYIENGAAVAVTGNISITDIDSSTIESAVVTISNNFLASEDQLTYIDQSGITGNYDNSTGILLLNGTATIADYESALHSITYHNTNSNPDLLMRSVSFVVNDGSFDSNLLSRDISIVSVNDAPSLTTIESNPTIYTEGNPAVVVTNSLSVGDVDDTHIETASVTIGSNFIAGEDELTFASQSGIGGSYNALTGVLTMTGTATLAEYQSALRSVTYQNSSDSPTELPRTISIAINDGDVNSNIVSRDISIAAVNDAPVLSTIEALPAYYTEDGGPVSITGNLAVSDIDDSSIEAATVSITNNYIPGDDHLNFTDQAGITGNFDSATGILTLTGTDTLANYQNALHSVTYHSSNDNPSALPRTVSFLVNDGDIDSNILTRDVNIIPANDAPVLSTIEALPVNFNENSGPSGITGNLSVSDIDDTNIESAVVSIAGNFVSGEDHLGFADQFGITGNYDSATGVLTLTGSATIAEYQSALHSVNYQNVSNNPTLPARSVSFTVNDGTLSSNTLTRAIDLTAVNDAPALSAIETTAVTYSENSTPVVITNSLSLTDIDDTLIESARLSISNNFIAGEDQLLFIDQAGISGNYDSATGILTMTGTATIADYETALRSVTFDNSSNNPSTALRTVTFEVSDGDTDSNLLSRDINISASNDAPVLAGIEPQAASYTENTASLAITGNLTVGDIDSAVIASATVAISNNFASGEDHLTFSNQTGITGNYDAATGVLTLTGSASLADYQNALRSAGFENSSNDPSTLPRTISFTVSDGDKESNVLLREITINPVNDAPVLAAIESDPAHYIENAAPIAVTANLSINDIDDTVIESAAVILTGNFVAGEDYLVFNDQSGIAGSYDSTTGELALTGSSSLTDYQTALRSVTYYNASENPTPATRTISFEVSDGELFSNTLLRDISLTPVNDAPSGTDFSFNVIEGSTHTFDAAEFGFSDLTENHSFAALQILTPPASGELQLSGSTVSSGATVTYNDLASGSLSYVPPLHTEGDADTTFTFKVQDDGGTANGGENTDLLLNTATITNRGVNDAPIINSGSGISTLEDTAYPLQIADFGFSDPEGHALQSIRVESLPVGGVLELNNIAVSVGTVVTANELASNQLKFHPDSNSNNTETFTFVVTDNGGVANGGTDTAATPGAMTLEIQPVNDAPTGQSSTVSMIEDIPFILGTAQFQIDDSDGHQLKEIIIAAVPATGTLQLNGASVSSGDVVTATSIANGEFVYLPQQDATGGVQTGLTFYVRDTGGSDNGGIDTSVDVGEISFDIVAVNDSPQGLDTTIAILEDTPLTITTSMFGYTDTDSNSLAGVLFATLPQKGSLLLNGTAIDVNTTVAAADIINQRLMYKPDQHAHGDNHAQIAFYVIDSGTGQNTSGNANVLTIDVIPVNDPPVSADATISMQEDTIYTLLMSDFAYSDSSDAPFENSISAITLTTVPQNGTLMIDGSAATTGSVISVAEILSGKLQFMPAADAHAQSYASFDYKVSDDGGSNNGGIDTSTQSTAITFSVANVNDAPISISDEISLPEATSATGSVLDNDSDIDADTQLTVTLTDSPRNGSVSLNPDGGFTYTHNGSETTSDSFSYRVSDGELEDSAEVNITVIPVNDSPVARLIATHNTTEQEPTVINLPVDLFTDPDIDDTLNVQMIGLNGNAPAWLEFDRDAMTISGTPPADGVFVVRLVATDSSGAEAYSDLVINVAQEPQLAAAQGAASDNAPEQEAANKRPAATTTSSASYANNPVIFERYSERDTETQIKTPQSVAIPISTIEPLPRLDIEFHNIMHKPKTAGTVLDAIAVDETPAPELFQPDNIEWRDSKDKLGDQLDSNNRKLNDTKALVVTGTGVSASLSIGYVVWLLRGGVLLGSVLTSLPAWRMIDPLPVLNDTGSGATDDTDNESLQDMVDTDEESENSKKAESGKRDI